MRRAHGKEHQSGSYITGALLRSEQWPQLVAVRTPMGNPAAKALQRSAETKRDRKEKRDPIGLRVGTWWRFGSDPSDLFDHPLFSLPPSTLTQSGNFAPTASVWAR